MYASTRSSRLSEFDNPSRVANVNSTTVTDADAQPFVTADGKELWFTSTRTGGLGGLDVYRASWNGTSFGNVAPITALSTSSADFLPTLSADKLEKAAWISGLHIAFRRATGFLIHRLCPN